ncbi:hypothetical protein VTK73DRAFT_9197 [Phialemonium thermophilum]|uniref:Uncharacterized protein n=1 Tax=Phialemonium thermophilum TaxID=223376 RepID=A0ABR3XLF3_9PEZI
MYTMYAVVTRSRISIRGQFPITFFAPLLTKATLFLNHVCLPGSGLASSNVLQPAVIPRSVPKCILASLFPPLHERSRNSVAEVPYELTPGRLHYKERHGRFGGVIVVHDKQGVCAEVAALVTRLVSPGDNGASCPPLIARGERSYPWLRSRYVARLTISARGEYLDSLPPPSPITSAESTVVVV